VRGIALSFYDWNGVDAASVGRPRTTIRELVADPVFRTALANNLRWLACYAVAPALGLCARASPEPALRGMRLVRSLFFMPFVMSQVVVGWCSLVLPSALRIVSNVILARSALPRSLLDSEDWSIYTMIVAGLWPQVAYCMMLYLTGLAALPAATIDSARVDGASGWTLFRHVVLPQLRPVHFIVAMVCAVSALRSFDYVVIMTLGGPFDSSTVLAYFMYEQTFLGQRYGYGAAIATVLLLLMSGIIVALLVRMFRQERRH
jgi:multiple sugar transport system permease protein